MNPPAGSLSVRANSRMRPFAVTREGGLGLTYEATRSSGLQLTSRGVRLPSAAASTELGRLLAAQLPLREECVLSHTTAARLHGLPLPLALERDLRVHVTMPRELPRPRRRDIVTHHARLLPEQWQTVGDLRLTTVARTYVDMAGALTFDSLVALGDVALRAHRVTEEELLAMALWRRRYPGRTRAVLAIDWLDAKAESPQESRLRVLLRQAGLPRPAVNQEIRDDRGRFLARGDLVFREARVIVEYDGEVHAPMPQRAKDAARRARLREAGWIVVEIVGEDMAVPSRVIDRVRNALRDEMNRRA